MKFDHLFNEMDLETEPFALCKLHGSCDLGLGRLPEATLHYILAGNGEIVLRNHPSISVQQGSLILVPAHMFHILRGSGKTCCPVPDCRPAELNLEEHIAAGEDSNPDNSLLAICSRIKVSLRGSHGVVDLVRAPIVERSGSNDVLSANLELIMKELSAPTIGSTALIRSLLLGCMIHVMRKRLIAGDPAIDWMKALSDENLWEALRTMLDKPGDAHSMESLAEAAGMSRSTFARHFANAYGGGPMELLRILRMTKAAGLLSTTRLPVKRIAEQTGFESRSAFNRAFVKFKGCSPREFRAEAKEKG